MKLKCDEPLLNVAFNFNLRLYTMEIVDTLDLSHTRRFLLEYCIMLDSDLALYDDEGGWAGDELTSESGEAAGGTAGGTAVRRY